MATMATWPVNRMRMICSTTSKRQFARAKALLSHSAERPLRDEVLKRSWMRFCGFWKRQMVRPGIDTSCLCLKVSQLHVSTTRSFIGARDVPSE